MKRQWALSITFVVSTILLFPQNAKSKPGNVNVDVKVHVNGKKVIDESHPKRHPMVRIASDDKESGAEEGEYCGGGFFGFLRSCKEGLTCVGLMGGKDGPGACRLLVDRTANPATITKKRITKQLTNPPATFKMVLPAMPIPSSVPKEVCVFSNGYLTSVFQEWLGETNSANECAVLVKSEKPSAIGATWSSIDNYDCYAEFGKPAEIVVHKYYKACLFSA